MGNMRDRFDDFDHEFIIMENTSPTKDLAIGCPVGRKRAGEAAAGITQLSKVFLHIHKLLE